MDNTIYIRSRGCSILTLTLLLCFVGAPVECANKIKLLFVGDIMLSRNVAKEINTTHRSPWCACDTFFARYDFVAGNLEGTLASTDEVSARKGESMIFPIDKKDLTYLKDAGFDLLSLENNHALDLGRKSKTESVILLSKSDITGLTLENSPRFLEIKGKTFSFVGINLVPIPNIPATPFPSVDILQKLRLARNLSDVVIVMIHWGSELLEWPNLRQREVADFLTKNGVDIVIGSHPHVVQMPEMVNGKPVFFSLGNHLFDQKYPHTQRGLMAEISIDNTIITCRGLVTGSKRGSYYPMLLDTLSLALDTLVLSHKPFVVENYLLKPISVNDTAAENIGLWAYRNDTLCWKSKPMKLYGAFAAKLDSTTEYLVVQEKHYSNMDNRVALRPYVYSVDAKGIYARWRGSTLAWPLEDFTIINTTPQRLEALHRGDSFLVNKPENSTYRPQLYQWNGFGFRAVSDSINIVNEWNWLLRK